MDWFNRSSGLYFSFQGRDLVIFVDNRSYDVQSAVEDPSGSSITRTSLNFVVLCLLADLSSHRCGLGSSIVAKYPRLS